MNSFGHTSRLRACCGRLLGALLVVFAVFMVTATASTAVAVDSSCSAECGADHDGEDDDDDCCDDECPGELPDGSCADSCQFCGCCGFVASSMLQTVTVATSISAPSWCDLPQLSLSAPTGVDSGIFRPPQRS